MPEAPAVSVVIPTRDRPSLLRQALDSVDAQRDVALEVVVIEDDSSEPRGVAATRNAGIGKARAPWVAFLDDDDLWSPGKLKRQLEVAEKANAPWAFSAAV